MEEQHVARSTLMREAYFVDFALAMQAKVSIPLMVTGGFRRRLAMEQAIEAGGADLIGLGRPLCVLTDGPARLLAGLEELPRYENRTGPVAALAGLPHPGKAYPYHRDVRGAVLVLRAAGPAGQGGARGAGAVGVRRDPAGDGPAEAVACGARVKPPPPRAAACHPCSGQINGMAAIVTSAISRFMGTPMRRKSEKW